MTNREAMRWVTPDSAAGGGVVGARTEFSPAAFVRDGGTLYSLSKEGRGSAGPLVTALTVAVTEAAEQLAKTSPGGRLPVPMVAVLDEAANVCRWRELPNLYSHYGSRGIVMMTILQSWSQGVEVWGRDGMRKLWSAANVKVYGGGVSEVELLSEVSQLVGDYDLRQLSTSYGKGGRSTRRERVLEVSELGALPRGRALLIASGVPPTLIKTVPGWPDHRPSRCAPPSQPTTPPRTTLPPMTLPPRYRLSTGSPRPSPDRTRPLSAPTRSQSPMSGPPTHDRQPRPPAGRRPLRARRPT